MTWTCPRCGSALPDRGGIRALTAMERRVLQCMVDGLTSNKIAADLGISYNTVRTHIQRIYPKLGVHSNIQAAAYAREHGLRLTAMTAGKRRRAS